MPSKSQGKTHPVTAEIVLHLADDETRSLPATLAFDPADPLAVQLRIGVGARSTTWLLSRDLLCDGRYGSAGDHDVQIWPSLCRDLRATVIVELHGKEGSVALQIEGRVLHDFVDSTLAMVPRGTEVSDTDVEDFLTTLLG